MPADSFYDAIEFNRQLQCDSLQVSEPHDPVGCFIRELNAIADEFDEITRDPEGCDQYLADSDKIMSAGIKLNLACHRIIARANETRIQRRLVEIAR